MSQVRKLQKGNSIPIAENGYKFILDNQEYNVTDDQLKEIDSKLVKLDPNLRRFLGGWTSGIKSGNSTGNRMDNTVSMNMISGVGKRDTKRLEKQKPNFWESLLPTDSYYAKQAIAEALNTTYSVLSKSSDKSSSSSKKSIGSDTIPLDFNVDENGNYYLSPYSNAKAKERVSTIIDHLKAGDSSEYDSGDWYFGNISNYITDEGGYDAAQKKFEDLWTEMGTPGYKFSQNIEDLLSQFKITKGNYGGVGNPNNQNKTETQKLLETDFKNNPNLYDRIGENFQKGTDGVWRLKPDGIFDIGLTLAPDQGIWFNDDFYRSKYGSDLRLAALKNLVYYKGALYDLNSPVLASILNSAGGYNELMRNGDFAGANNIIWTDFTPLASMIPQILPENMYSEFLSNNPAYRFSNITGTVQNLIDAEGHPYELPKDYDIIQYLNLDEPIIDENPFVRYQYKYKVLDPSGKEVTDISRFNEIPRANASAFKSWYPRIVGTGDQNYDGRYYIDIKDSYNSSTGYRFYIDPNNQNDVYIHIPNLKASGVSDTDDIALPPEVAKILLDNKTKWIDKVVSNKNYQRAFGRFISKLLQAKTRQAGVSFIPFDPNAYEELFSTDKGLLKDLGFSDSDIDTMVSEMHKTYNKGTIGERRLRYRRTNPLIEKNGGKLQYIAKLAEGGVSGATNAISEKGRFYKVNSKASNTKNAAPITHIGQEDFGTDDYLDLAALVADLGSLGAAFVPGANVASAGIGAAGSFARFGADLNRDVNGLSAVGGLLLNLTMDAATLIPFAGALAKDVKTINTIKKSLPTIIKAASYYGLGSAVVESAKRIANNEEWTTRDVANLINGITAATGIVRYGGFGKQTKTIKGKRVVPDQSFTIGNTTKKLSGAKIESISKLPSNEQLPALRKALKEQFPEANDQQIAEVAEKVLKEKKHLFKDNDIVVNAKKKRSTQEVTEGIEGGFHDWKYRTGELQKQHLAQLRGEIPMETKAYKLERTDTDVAATFPRKYRTKGTVKAKEIPLTQYNGRTFNSQVNPSFSTFGSQGPGMVYNGTANYSGTMSYRRPVKIAGIAIPQWFSPWNFKNNYEHQELPEFKKGGTIKAYDGMQLKVGKQEPINDRILYGISIKRLDKNGIGRIEYYDEIPESVLRTILKFEPQSIVTQSGDLSGAKAIQTQVTQASPIKPEQQQIQVGTQPELEQSTETPIEVSTEKPTEVSSELQEPLVIGPRVVHPSFIYRPAESFEPYTLTRSPLITSDVPPITLDVPMSKQKVVKVKTNENKNFNDLVDILESLVNKHQKGGVVKGQDGLEIDQKYIDDEFEKSWKGVLSSIPSTTGGGYTYNLPGIINNLIPFVSLAGFAANAGYQNKYNRQWKSAVEAGRFHELPVTLNTPRPDNPIYDRALQNIRSERMIGIKPYTSNWTEFNAAKRQYDSNLWNKENSIIGQQSSDWSDKQNQILNIQNQNLSNFITTANSNRARDAAIESAKGQADMALTQQRAQSLDNLLYEFKTNMAKDKQLMQAFGQRQYANTLQKGYNDLVDRTFSGARAAYSTLPAEESAKYYDLEDYIRQTRPDEWAANYDTLAKEQERIADNMARWNYVNGLYYSYPSIMMPRSSSIGVPFRKKGGRLTGKTRYRYEPDEQILIDNNKAAHAAIAKLNDNTIKLLLRALK